MRKILFVLIALFAFSFSGVLTHLCNREDDKSLRYILWKKGVHPYPSEIIRTALCADIHRNELIRGKTKEEIKQMFPNAQEESVNDYQKRYESTDLKGKDYLWLDENHVVFFFENGLATEIGLMKG